MGVVYPGQTFRVVGCGGCSGRDKPFVGVGLSRGNLFVQLVRAARAVNVQRSCTETTLRYNAPAPRQLRYVTARAPAPTLPYSAPAPRQRYVTTLLHRDNLTLQRSYTKTTLRYNASARRQSYGTALLHQDNVMVQRSCTETPLRYSAPAPRQRYCTGSCTEATLSPSHTMLSLIRFRRAVEIAACSMSSDFSSAGRKQKPKERHRILQVLYRPGNREWKVHGAYGRSVSANW